MKIANVVGINSAGQDVHLTEVCQKLPYNKNCVIESITQYYQNDEVTLDREISTVTHTVILANYLDHFLSCAQ